MVEYDGSGGGQPADLEAAWEYARRSPLEIERSIWENQAVMEEEGGDRRLALIVRGWQLGLQDTAIADAFSPPLTGGDLAEARQDYLARREAFDNALAALLPEELTIVASGQRTSLGRPKRE